MANRDYQFETSPRKLEPEYQPVRKKAKKKTTKKVNTQNKNKKKSSKKSGLKSRTLITMNLFIIFAILFVMIYR